MNGFVAVFFSIEECSEDPLCREVLQVVVADSGLPFERPEHAWAAAKRSEFFEGGLVHVIPATTASFA